jgi:hypothetical protein
MLALAIAFLVATTVGITPPPRPPAHPPVKPTASATPSRKPTAQPTPALDLRYVAVNLSINPSAVMSGDPAAIAAIRSKVTANPSLKGRLAGLVLLYAGDDNGSYQPWLKLDAAMWKILRGADSAVFNVAVTRDFYTHGGPSTQFQFDVYLFKTS